jgi:uncharacterized membrane protein YqhA
MNPVRAALERTRYLAVVAVGGLLAVSVVTLGWAVAKTVLLTHDLLTGGWRDETVVVALLIGVDTYLLALVLLIVAIGLFELFVGDLDVPAWLEIRSLDDLKKRLIDMLVLFLAIKGVEKLVSAKEPIDALVYAGAVAVLIVALTVFRAVKSSARPTT